jgi:putative FmdB family regulatory protein
MPLFEFQCKDCDAVTEVFSQRLGSNMRPLCARCGSRATRKIISQVSFKIARAAKYSDEFLHKARPFLRSKSETAQVFAEAKGSEDARTFQMAERIGTRIDQTLKKALPRKT